MRKNKNPLAKALDAKRTRKAKPAPAAAPVAAATETARTVQPSRVGRVMIGAHYTPEVQRQVKIICATEGKQLQELLAEALNMVFAKYGQPEIATAANEKTAAA
jgi:antitoxin-like ribbon-helix-helix protein